MRCKSLTLLCNESAFALVPLEPPMNTMTQPSSEKSFTLQPLRPSELANVKPPPLNWLWHGYLAPGKITALISPPKTGKTTLAANLLARLAQGGQLAGLAVTPARAIVVSEESASDWDARCRKLALPESVQFLCRPFKGARPTETQWFDLIAGLESLHRQNSLNLLAIDPLAALLPGHAENSAPKMFDCLLPLQNLANQGIAVWLMHHPARATRADGQASRGSSALSGFADIIMEMNGIRRARSRDRRRRICAYSRSTETPRHLIVELTADGADYVVRTDPAGAPLVQSSQEVHYILAHATDKLSRQTILERWPDEESRPDPSTLSRWLKRAAKQGLICCSGAGFRGDSYVYWLPGHEPLLWPGSNASEEEKEAWRVRRQAYALGQYKPAPSA
jgi:hypothetical protein